MAWTHGTCSTLLDRSILNPCIHADKRPNPGGLQGIAEEEDEEMLEADVGQAQGKWVDSVPG